MLREETRDLRNIRISVTAALAKLKVEYEAGFAKVESTISLTAVPMVGVNSTTSDGARTATHHQIVGVGDSAQEALADWKEKFDQLPRAGDQLYWRVEPELISDFDYVGGHARWQVYARLAIFEMDEVR